MSAPQLPKTTFAVRAKAALNALNEAEIGVEIEVWIGSASGDAVVGIAVNRDQILFSTSEARRLCYMARLMERSMGGDEDLRRLADALENAAAESDAASIIPDRKGATLQ